MNIKFISGTADIVQQECSGNGRICGVRFLLYRAGSTAREHGRRESGEFFSIFSETFLRLMCLCR